MRSETEIFHTILNNWVKRQMGKSGPVLKAGTYEEYLKGGPKLGQFEADFEADKYCKHYNDCPYREGCDEKWGQCPYYRDLERTK